VKWDEEIIAEHDKERGTRQKIDEPPTPYRYGSDDDNVDDDENKNVPMTAFSASGQGGDVHTLMSTGQEGTDIMDKWTLLQAKLQYEQANQDNDLKEHSSPPPHKTLGHYESTKTNDDAGGEVYARDINDVSQPEIYHTETVGFEKEPQEPSAAFKNKRNAHYNEFQLMQAMRTKMAEDDDEEDG
jgi:protein phosphatase inhibitor 2